MNGHDVKRIREQIVMLSQSKFSEIYGINLFTLRQWERKNNSLDTAVASYMSCIEKDHKRVENLLHPDEQVKSATPKKKSPRKR